MDKKDGIIYTNLTGNFPVRSIDEYTTFFILHDWTKSEILATPIKYPRDEDMVATFKGNIEYMGKGGFKPVFNVIDNMAPKAVQAYLKKAKVGT